MKVLIGLLLFTSSGAHAETAKPVVQPHAAAHQVVVSDCTRGLKGLPEQLIRLANSNKFITQVMRAQADRLGKGWSCDHVGDWQLSPKKEIGLKARTTVTCFGPEQHLNVTLNGTVEVIEESRGCEVRVFSFKESLGD